MSMQEMSKRLEEMEKRLTVLEDIEAIKRLQTEYANMLQAANYDNVGDLFAEDAVFEAAGPRTTGRDEIVRVYQENISKNQKWVEEGCPAMHPEAEVRPAVHLEVQGLLVEAGDS